MHWLGWALAQHPHLVFPELTILGAAAPRSVLVAVLIALGVGGGVLVPALAYPYDLYDLYDLCVVFKARPRGTNLTNS